jgi:hypothetical protein
MTNTKIHRSIGKQILLAALLITLLHPETFSQENDSLMVKSPGLFVGLSLGAGQSQIINTATASVSGLNSVAKNSIRGNLEIGYYFSGNFGLSSGIGFSSYKGQTTLNAYQNKFNTTDSENDAYERRVSGTHITEDQNIGFLTIPILMNLSVPVTKAFGLFLQGGVNLDIPIQKKYSSSGTFTYKGYYPVYNLVLEDLPTYGFPTNAAVTSNGQLDLKPICLEATASAGFDFSVQKKMKVAIAACYIKSLTNISAYSTPDNFRLSPDVNLINSLMGGSSMAMVQSLGLKISVRYSIGK